MPDLKITKEWFEKRAALEGDLEIGVGRRLTSTINLSDDEVADLERLMFEALPQWAQDKITVLEASQASDLLAALKLAQEYMNLSLGSTYEGVNPFPIIQAAIARAEGKSTIAPVEA